MSANEPYDGDDLREMELAIYRGRGVSASAGIRQLRQAQADAATAARVRALAARLDSFDNPHDTFYSVAQVAAMLRDGEHADDSDIMPGSEFDGPVIL